MVDRRATYRVQLNPRFGFGAASEQLSYLAELGISHVYCSPYLQAAPGSTHGYDVVDHGRVNDELGGSEGHADFCRIVQDCGMSQLLDIVPNHMAIGSSNPAWSDVLENGPSSRFAAYFDVDWAPPEERLREKILLPILGDHYGKVLEEKQLRIERDGGAFFIRYFEHTIPVSPRTLGEPLAEAASWYRSDELGFIADALEGLPLPNDMLRESLERRHRDRKVLREHLQRLMWNDANLARVVDQVLSELSEDLDRLDAFLSRQNSRLAYWRSASRDLGYRRFFDINTLIALRVEDPQVFAETHSLPIEWLQSGVIDGVRVDHPDGLRDPMIYFERLRTACPNAWIVVEKILERGERLPSGWPVQGTTGYDFMNIAGGLFIWRQSETTFTRFYELFTGNTSSLEETGLACKQAAISDLLGSDVNRLTALFVDICEQHRRYRDYTRHEAHEVLKETLCSMSVYRTYVRHDRNESQPSEHDVTIIQRAFEQAMARRPDLDGALFKFLQDILLGRHRAEACGEMAARFQQLSGPVMAKGIEDTSFYQYLRFAALNEVGGDPSHFGVSDDEFHEFCVRMQGHGCGTLLATSTHDTKRSEDVRARLWVLSEIPERWQAAVTRWSERLERYRKEMCPERNTEYLFYQSLVGAWPIDEARISAYLEKATREAKTYTTWTRPNATYETALREFVHAAMGDEVFMSDVQLFVSELIEPGRVNSLAFALLKLTAPGIPDIYQGTELWDLSLVDPDNRRPVDFAQRRRLLDEAKTCDAQACMRRSEEGLPKLWLIMRALDLRKRRPSAFGAGATYAPIRAQGECAPHIVAYCRNNEVIVAAPRWCLRREKGWQDTSIEVPDGRWTHCLTGERVSGGRQLIEHLTATFPVALLERVEATR